MINLFDEVAKALASGISRRQAIWRLGGVFGASRVSFLGFSGKLEGGGHRSEGGLPGVLQTLPR